MPDMDDLQRHLRARSGDVAPWVLLPGDPGRAERIAAAFATAEEVARNREYLLFSGATAAGSPVSVCSTGIGGPSAAIALEELSRIGAHTFIRVGSAGGRQPHLAIGSLVIATAAFRGEGTSHEYIDARFPAVADIEVTLALRAAAAEQGEAVGEGIVYSRDAFYRRDDALNERLREAGVVASEMECATLYVVGSLLGVRVGAVLGTDSNIWLDPQPGREEKERLYRDAERRSIEVALGAVDLLHGAGAEA